MKKIVWDIRTFLIYFKNFSDLIFSWKPLKSNSKKYYQFLNRIFPSLSHSGTFFVILPLFHLLRTHNTTPYKQSKAKTPSRIMTKAIFCFNSQTHAQCMIIHFSTCTKCYITASYVCLTKFLCIFAFRSHFSREDWWVVLLLFIRPRKIVKKTKTFCYQRVNISREKMATQEDF